jgi:hypothetical protein
MGIINQLQEEEKTKNIVTHRMETLQVLWGIFKSAHGVQNTSVNCAVLKQLLLQCGYD